MSPLWLPLIGLASVYWLWIFYLAVMNLKRAKHALLLHKSAVVLGTPVLIVGYLLDAFANVFVFTVLLLEMPQELTVTARLKRHIKESTDWRSGVASWFIPLLDPFDPSGKHIT
jgi:hypothetical protein